MPGEDWDLLGMATYCVADDVFAKGVTHLTLKVKMFISLSAILSLLSLSASASPTSQPGSNVDLDSRATKATTCKTVYKGVMSTAMFYGRDGTPHYHYGHWSFDSQNYISFYNETKRPKIIAEFQVRLCSDYISMVYTNAHIGRLALQTLLDSPQHDFIPDGVIPRRPSVMVSSSAPVNASVM